MGVVAGEKEPSCCTREGDKYGGWEKGERDGTGQRWLQEATLGYLWGPWTGLERNQVMLTCNTSGQGCVAKVFQAHKPEAFMSGLLLAFQPERPGP